MKKPFYSIGIIFKNEIRCLERCLSSLKPLLKAVPCEIVMADTGSTDGSREVAAKYADILFDFPWIDDFAAARNAVIERCSGVWYISIDADEWSDGNITELVLFSKAKKPPEDIAAFTIRNCKSAQGADSDDYMDFSALRMMRLASGLRYEGCIHEKFNQEPLRAMQLPNTLFYHDGYYYGTRAVMEEKRQRNLKLLEKKLEHDPENLQTVTEYIDSMKAADPDVVDPETIAYYAKRSLELLHKNWERWGPYGATVYRNAVSVAKLHDMPELFQWAEKAVELFPDSIYTRIDVAYYAFGRSWDENRPADTIRWGEVYLAGLADYRAGNINQDETMRGVIEFASPVWERQMLIVFAQARLELDEPEKARDILSGMDGGAMDKADQVEGCVNIMMRMHRTTNLDMGPLAARLWEQVNRPTPDEKTAEERRNAYLKTASRSFELSYLADELRKEGFLRHSYTMFLALEDSCQLHAFAAMLEEADTAVLADAMVRWDGEPMPVSILFHALERGVAFPLPGKPQRIESMETLAKALAKDPKRLGRLILAGIPMENVQQAYWARTLGLAAVRSCKWEENEAEEGGRLARRFAEVERRFISMYYAPELSSEEAILLLPPMHRFGWWCARAFDALDAGDPAEYVRHLRAGLEACGDMKSMVEFLVDHTPALQAPPPSAEMLALAEQIRAVLANFAPDDPAVAALKQSEAYQKVAHLIEGTPATAWGGLTQ